jgi:hypothetical protein
VGAEEHKGAALYVIPRLLLPQSTRRNWRNVTRVDGVKDGLFKILPNAPLTRTLSYRAL